MCYEYKVSVRSFYDDLVNARHTLAFCNFIYFFPKKYLIEDDELQLRLLYFMQNRKTNFFDSCYMFQKIIRNNGKLYFSKDLEKNKEYIETFIKYYFTYLNLYILCDDKVTRQNYVSPIPMLNKDEQRKLKFEKSPNNDKIFFSQSIFSIISKSSEIIFFNSSTDINNY